MFTTKFVVRLLIVIVAISLSVTSLFAVDTWYPAKPVASPPADSKTSHGCVRLTNWDAMRLALLLELGTPVQFQ